MDGNYVKSKCSMKELISIIIPVYNIEAYLPRCLDSVTKQSYRNLEIILVDDGSIDSSWQICKAFAEKDSRITIIQQNNGGPYVARNTGFGLAHGDYILFVDGDDYMHQDTIRIMYEAINGNGGYDMAMVNYKKTTQLDEDVEEKCEYVTTDLTQTDLMTNMFRKSKRNDEELYHYLWNKLFRRKLIDDLLFYGDPRMEDFEYCFRVFLRVQRAIWIHCDLYFYVLRPNSIVHQREIRTTYYSIRTKQIFREYQSLSFIHRKRYGYLLLQILYRRMAFVIGDYWKTDSQKEMFDRCYEYERKTRKDYLLSWRINPLEKIVTIFFMHFPRLTRWFMKVTNRYTSIS